MRCDKATLVKGRIQRWRISKNTENAHAAYGGVGVG